MFGFTFFNNSFFSFTKYDEQRRKNNIFGKITGLENIFRVLEKCNA